MESISLKGEVRKSLGKADAKALRNAGQVPCIIYGGKENVHFSADLRQFKKLVYTPNVYIVQVELDGNTHDTIIKDFQFHPISDAVIHVDFQLLTDRPVSLHLPIRLNGTPIGVRNGGALVTPLRTLSVKGMPKNMPDAMMLDIEELKIGMSIKVADLTLEGGEIMNSPSNVVVAVRTKRGAVEDVEEDDDEAEGDGEKKEEAAAESK